MSSTISAALMIIGAAFMLVAAIGVFRMPDLLTRMHATSKAGALGTGLILCSVAVYYIDLGVTARSVAAVAFVILTAPVAAHVIGRAAHFVGVPLWEGTIIDELRHHHDSNTSDSDAQPGDEDVRTRSI
jgi:multicomponent Na+:H+ antiporter subunit G